MCVCFRHVAVIFTFLKHFILSHFVQVSINFYRRDLVPYSNDSALVIYLIE